MFAGRIVGSRSRGAAAALAAGLLLAGCGAPSHRSSSARSSGSPLATASLPVSSLCAPDQGDYVRQSLDGSYAGCFRVPALPGTSTVVTLQTDISIPPPTGGPTTVAPPTPVGAPALTLSSRVTAPGASVVITGHYAHHRPTALQRRGATFATLCWNGCDALQEQGVAVHWSSPATFHVTLVVPDAAWLVTREGRVAVHPLVSGRYQVGVQCLIVTPGCAAGPPDASVTLALRAPAPTRCVAGRRCATMTLSAAVARIGDRVLVRGWAPLQSIIGEPFGYSLSVTTGSARRHYPPLTVAPLAKGGASVVEVAPTTMRLAPSPTWAALGRIRDASSTFSGPSAVSPAPSSSLVAWCQSSGIVITGAPTAVLVPTTGAGAALRGSGLHGLERPDAPASCATVQLDPQRATTVYAGFATGHGPSIPPEYLAPLYTTNGGGTWHTVPIPAGASIEDFGGFATRGRSVAALFIGAGGYPRVDNPVGTVDGLVRTEVTSNAGATWAASTLGCPASGPCVTFGPFPWGNCNMSNAFQALLLGPPRTTAAGVRWTTSSWVSSVDSCYPQQLVVSSSHEMFLLDPSSQYPLQEATTSGRVWFDVTLPALAAAHYGVDSVPTTNSLVLAPDGSLFAVVTTPSQLSQALFRLGPGASSWCRIPRVLGPSIATSGVAAPLRVTRTDLVWSQTTYPSAAAPVTTRHTLALTDARCPR